MRGTLVALAWPQVAALLLGMALERTGGALASYCLDAYTPAGSRRQSGVMAQTLEVVASADGGDVSLRLGLVGRAEEALAGLTEADFDYCAISPVGFSFRGAAVGVDGAALTSVGGFRLRVDNGLEAGPAPGGRRPCVPRGRPAPRQPGADEGGRRRRPAGRPPQRHGPRLRRRLHAPRGPRARPRRCRASTPPPPTTAPRRARSPRKRRAWRPPPARAATTSPGPLT